MPVVAIPTVTAIPVPPPPWKERDGGDRYPAPGLVMRILSIAKEVVSPSLLVVFATAVAVMPPVGAEEMATVGVALYPLPELRRSMN